MNVFLSNELLDTLSREDVELGFSKLPYNQVYRGPEKDCDVFALTVNGDVYWPISPNINLLTSFENSKIEYDASANRFCGNLPEQVDFFIDVLTYALNDYGTNHGYGKEFSFNDKCCAELKDKLIKSLDQEYNVMPKIELGDINKDIWSGSQYDTWYYGTIAINDKLFDFNYENGAVTVGQALLANVRQSEADWIDRHQDYVSKYICNAVKEEEQRRMEKHHKRNSPML